MKNLKKYNKDHNKARYVALEWKQSLTTINELHQKELDILKLYDEVLHGEFCKQMDLIKCKGLRSQKTVVLMLLQLSLIYNVIKTKIIDHQDEKSFCGWKSFEIIDRSFIGLIYNYFPTCINRISINNVFRRCGFTPNPLWKNMWDRYDENQEIKDIVFSYNGMKN